LAPHDITRETRILHAGYGAHGDAGPFLPGPQFSSTFSTPGDPATHALTYGRFHNPTWSAWETALGKISIGDNDSCRGGQRSLTSRSEHFASGRRCLGCPLCAQHEPQI
jgi:cystathionine gamma-lyase